MRPAVRRALWGLALAGLVVLLGLASRSGIDSAAQDGYSRDVRRLQALDAQLSDHVMRSRSGEVESYDAIVTTLAELRRTSARLEHVPAFLGHNGRDEVHGRLRDFRDALQRKQERIDAFKTHNAVLRNSLRFFPVAAEGVARHVAAEQGGAELARTIDDLLRDVLVLNVMPDRDLTARTLATLSRAEAGVAPATLTTDVELLLKHARVILAKRPIVDALMEEILGLPVSARAEQLDATYSRRYHASLETWGRRRLGLSLLGVTLVAIIAAAVILRLERSAVALRVAAEDLAVANEALRREREREKELGELKSRFVSMTTHEFRTPLSVILSSSEMLESYADRWPDEKKRTHYGRIRASVRGMAKLLDGILLIGRAEAGVLACAPAPLDVPSFLADLVEPFQESAGSPHRIDLDITADGWEDVSLDERLVSQILTNLLTNALKYSPGGGPVRVGVHRDGGDAVFEVEDRGIGIPLDDQARLFEIFHRGSNTRAISGTGLGLAIVKKAVELHGGTVSFDSRPGEGTRFTTRLPIQRDSNTRGTDA